ncbi:hypothetical protein ACHAPK_009266 [Fusarium culmorum]
MAPVGVITIIVSAIRVTGPRWLKAVVGRARENVAGAELEVMSSTSSETCELWNGKTKAVVRYPGTTENCEFICIYPTSMLNKRNTLKRVRIMDIKNARNRGKTSDFNHRETQAGTAPLDEHRSSLISPDSDDTIIITRNTAHFAPNMTLNCSADGERWQMWACAAVGIIIQSGVLIFSGFLTEYKKMRFEKDDSPVEKYAMPMSVVGTLVLNLGILVCAHAVDESSKETVHEVSDSSAAVAMVWLQKKTKVSEQDFDSAAIYPTMKRSRAYTSERTIDNDGSQKAEVQDNGWWLKFMSTTGTAISLIGFFVQFIGLRGMHWLATITQLGAIIVMTILRAVVRRHLASGLASHDLCYSKGFELEWFVPSFLDKDGIPWIPSEHSKAQPADNDDNQEPSSKFSFKMETNAIEIVQCEKPSDNQKDSVTSSSLEVSTLESPQGVLDLRRHLGELSKWKGSAFREALAVAKAVERTMNFIMAPFDRKQSVNEFVWSIKVNYNRGPDGNNNDDTAEYVRVVVKYSPNNGWTAPVDEIAAALSLWLCSMEEVHDPASGRTSYDFPSGNDRWIRGSPAQQQRCLQVLGPLEDVLLRDLKWWMPKGLDGILAARVKDPNVDNNDEFPYTVKRERVAQSGQRWPKREWTKTAAVEKLSHWKWKSATDFRRHDTDSRENEGHNEVRNQHNNPGDPGQPAPKSFDWLAVESQDPLERLYAKDLFSSFLWAVATHLEESTISRQLQANIQPSSETGHETWKTFSLENQELSRFVQSLTELGLWTEREAWHSVIPPLSATDNLPGLNAVIEMAQKTAAVPEMGLSWRQAGSAYRWLFKMGMASSPKSHIYVKSTAILWRFHQRLSSSESPHVDEAYHERGDGLKEELATVQECLTRQEQIEALTRDLSVFFFDIHNELERLRVCDAPINHYLENQFAKAWSRKTLERRRDFGAYQRPGDIFDRTQLHHAMRSKFADHEELPNQEARSNIGDRRLWLEHGPESYVTYIKFIEPVKTKLDNLSLYPLRLLEDFSSAILFPFQTVQRLLDSGADPVAQDLDHWTPLHYACELSRLDSARHDQDCFLYRDSMRVTTLIANKADVNAKGLDGNTPLHCAAMSGRIHLVELLIEAGGDINAANFEGRTPLHLAAMKGDLEIIYTLDENGCSTEAKDEAGRTPLHLATISGQLKCIDELIKNGAKLDSKDKSDSTPLYLAAIGDSQKAIKSLCNVDALSYSMSKAIQENDLDLISLFMDNIDPDSRPLVNADGDTPFHEAATNAKLTSLDKIFEKSGELGLNPEVILKRNMFGSTVFHGSRLDSIKTMLKYLKTSTELLKRLIETEDEYGYSALFQAIGQGDDEVACLLIDEGADLRTRSNYGSNILHKIVGTAIPPADIGYLIDKIKERADWAQTLREMLHETDDDGRTTLDEAKKMERTKSIELLEKVLEECSKETSG